MKKMIYLAVCALALLLLAGCGTPETSTNESQSAASNEIASGGIADIEYMDITGAMLKGAYLGKTFENAGVKAENIFVRDDTMLGVDYVSLGDIKGSFICYLSGGKISSCNFGSAAFENKTVFYENLIGINKLVAKALNVQEAELKFVGTAADGEVSELDKVFDGKGIFTAEYQAETYKITLNGMGVNAAATIVVELQSVNGGGE